MRTKPLVAAALAAVMLPPGCAAPAVAQYPLPSGAEVVVVAPAGAHLLLGTLLAGRPALLLDGAEVPLASSGGYAQGARWQAIAADGDRVSAVAGEPGGAHGNVRWTVWTGTTGSVTEEPQAFETFGGWGMGQLVGVAYVSGEPMVVGTWQSDAAGFDLALWRREPSGAWRRQPATPATASTTAALVQPSAATGATGRLVVVGQTYDLAADRVRATAWILDGGAWARLELPSAATFAAADSVSCDGSGCLVGGRGDGVVTGWVLPWGGAPAQLAMPSRPADEGTGVFAARAAASYLFATTAGRTLVLAGDGSGWRVVPSAVTGRPTSAVAASGRAVVVTTEAGRTRVWAVGG